MRRRCRRCHEERGASLVEFALLLPIFMMLILGTFSGGIAYNRKNSMTNAVREGTRFGATLPDGASWATDVRDRVVDVSSGDLTASQVCVQLVKTPATIVESFPASPTPCPLSAGAPSNPTGVASGICIVKVWAARTSKLEVVVFSSNLTLNAQAVARYERTCP